MKSKATTTIMVTLFLVGMLSMAFNISPVVAPSVEGDLYAGGSNPGVVYKYVGGTEWQVISPSLGYAILDLVKYDDHLYAGVMSSHYSSVGQVYRYDGGTSWTLVGDNMDMLICSLAVYQGDLYAGTGWSGMKLYKYIGGTSWTQVIPSPPWDGTRALHVSHGYLLMGELGYDRFGRWDGTTFYQDQPVATGSCIWDYEDYNGNVYASAYAGRMWQSPDAINWNVVLGYYGGGDMWELETFQNSLYMSYNYGELRVSNVPDRGTLVYTAPDGIISMETDGNNLYFGTGGEAGYYRETWGIASVYRYDGTSVVRISDVDEMVTGVQVLLHTYIPVGRTITKTLNTTEGHLGDVVHVTLTVTVPNGETATAMDTLPSEWSYINGSFTIDGVPATPTITENRPPPPIITEVSYTITEPESSSIEFDCKVDTAYWEDREVCNVATATWYNETGEIVDTKEDVECFTIHAFEELSKTISADEEPYHYLYVDGYTAERQQWTEVGVSPFLDAPDDGNYIVGTADTQQHRWFTFEDLELGDFIIDHVQLEVYCEGPYNEAVDYDIYAPGFNWLGSWYGTGVGNRIWQDTPRWIGTGYSSDFYPALLTQAGINGFEALCYYYDPDGVGVGNDIIDSMRLCVKFAECACAGAELTTKVGTETRWRVVMSVTNPFSYTMENVTITDNFGAELEIDEVVTSPDTNLDGVVDIFDLSRVGMKYGTRALVDRGEWDPAVDINNDGYVDVRDLSAVARSYGITLWLTGRSDKVHLFWYIGDLAPGETARITILVSTDLNPAGHQEYTEPGIYEMNSGATLKFIDPEQDMQLSAVTDSIYVTVLPENDC